MSGQIQRFDASSMKDEMLSAAARLFSNNYGIWGVGSKQGKKSPKQ